MSELRLDHLVSHWQALASGGLIARVAGIGAELAQQGQAQARQNAADRLTMRSWALWESIDGFLYPHPAGVHIGLMAGGPGAKHAVYQELGTRGRASSAASTNHAASSFSTPPAGTAGGLPAKHFLRDAFQAQQEALRTHFLPTLAQALTNGR